MADFSNENKQKARIDELRKREEEDVVRILATRYGLNFIDLKTIPINGDALKIVEEAVAREAKLAVYDKVDKRLKIVIFSPNNPKAAIILKQLEFAGYKTEVSMGTTASLEKAWDKYKDISSSFASTAGTFDISSDQVVTYMNSIKRLVMFQLL